MLAVEDDGRSETIEEALLQMWPEPEPCYECKHETVDTKMTCKTRAPILVHFRLKPNQTITIRPNVRNIRVVSTPRNPAFD